MYQRLITLLISIAIISSLTAEIVVKSFRKLEIDMTARIDAPRKDRNGQDCAIIKVVTSQTNFAWEGDGLGIVAADRKTGEYWLYIPWGAKRLTIKHPQLGILRDFLYPTSIEQATVYELVLTTGKVTTIVDEVLPTKFLVITTTPSGADVFINEQHQGQTPFQQEMMVGEYTYSISKDLYYPIAGKVDLSLGSDKELINLLLKPNYGFLQITSKPEDGMTVNIDGRQLIQTTPLKTDTLKSGIHTITLSKNFFYPLTKDVVVMDNQTTPVEFVLRPAFGTLTLDTQPESGAYITLDGKLTGQSTPYRFEQLMTGEHSITVRREWYEPKTIKVKIEEGKEQQQVIGLIANFENVKVSTDSENDVYVDNEFKGKGSWEGRLLRGLHTFEAKKLNYRPSVQKVEIGNSESRQITLQPQPMLGKLKIVSNAIGAAIRLNDKEYGTTPAIINELLVGDYTLIVEKEGYKSLNKTITIMEGKTTEVTDNLNHEKQFEAQVNPIPISKKKPIGKDEKTKTPAKSTLRAFYKKHAVSVAYGWHTTNFANATFKEYIANGGFSHDYGHAATIATTFFPIELSASLFSSNFSAHNLAPFIDNAVISHRGIELGINYMPINIGTVFLPYIGAGYQFSQLYSAAENLTIGGAANTSTSMPMLKGGFKIKIDPLYLFGEYKKAFSFGDSDYQSNQLSAGIGWNF